MIDSPLYLGSRIHDRRTSLHLTLLDVAQRMGLRHNSVPSLWELGKRPVPAHRLDALARALETNPTWLLDGVVLVDEFLPPPILQLIPVALSTSPAQRPSEPDPEPGTQPTPEPDIDTKLLAPSEFELLWLHQQPRGRAIGTATWFQCAGTITAQLRRGALAS